MEDVRVRISLDSSQFDAGVDNAESGLGKLKGRMGEISSGLQSVGTKMAAVGVGMIGAVGGIVAAGAKWSASVESTQFLYDNLDASVQKSIEGNMKNAKALGMTEQQYKSNATSLGTFLGNMGFANKEIANMSEESMNLAADLGALADVPVDQAMGDFKSALMGNYEALDKYGVNISAATLGNSEYVKGLGKSWNQLSDNEKMMAVYNEVMNQSSSAQGLAAQEATSFSSQMKLLKESVGEAVGKLGSTLLPVLEPIAQKIQDVVGRITKWVEENPELARTILMVVAGIGAFLAIGGALVAIIGAIAGAMLLFSAASAPVTLTIAGIVLAVMALIAIVAVCIIYWDEIKAKAIEVWNAIKEAVTNAVKATGDFLKSAWEGIKNFLSTLWEGIKTVAMNVWNGIKNAISTVLNGIKTIITNIWNGIKNFVSNVLNGIRIIVTTIWNGIKTAISTVLNAIKTVVTNIWNNIKSFISNAVNGIKTSVSNAFNSLKNTVSNALNAVYKTAKGLWDKVTGIFKKPINAVVNFFKGGKSSFSPNAVASQSFSPMGAMSRGAGGYVLGASGGAPVSFSANMNTNVVLDGKTIAKASAPYMKPELDKMNRRQNRLGGR